MSELILIGRMCAVWTFVLFPWAYLIFLIYRVRAQQKIEDGMERQAKVISDVAELLRRASSSNGGAIDVR